MMLAFDFILLLVVSGIMAGRNLYLGSVTFIIGLLIGFQTLRVRSLLGNKVQAPLMARKIKAGILAVIFGLCLSPLLFDSTTDLLVKEHDPDNLIPILSVILLFSASMMAALVVERRKR